MDLPEVPAGQPCVLDAAMMGPAPAMQVEVEVEVKTNEEAPSMDMAETVEVAGCSNCVVLQKELDDCKRDRAFFVDIKKKMILTDTLIQKHQSKCQAFDEQQRKLQDVTKKLAQSKRDCRVLEEQLASTLKDIIPWKRDKERFMQELQDSKGQHDDFRTKITGQQTLIRHLEIKADQCDEEKVILESDYQILKAEFDSFKTREKKTTAMLDKSKDDIIKLKKEISEVKKSRYSLGLKFKGAEKKIENLQMQLLQHGVKLPRSRGFSTVNMEDLDTDHDDGHHSEDSEVQRTMTTRSQHLSTVGHHPNLPAPHPIAPQHHPAPITHSPRRGRSFAKMDFEAVACLSPLPPSPSPEDDNFLTDIAAKIDAQLSTPSAADRHPTQRERESVIQSIRVSPRRRRCGFSSDDTKSNSAGLEDDESDSGPCRALRSGKKIPQSGQDIDGVSSQRIGLRASKKLDLEESDSSSKSSKGREIKSRRGRKRKVEDALPLKDNKDRAGMKSKTSPAKLRDGTRTLSSSEDEEESISQGKRESRPQHVAKGMRTRSRAKDLSNDSSEQRVMGDATAKFPTMQDDLLLSSDEETKPSVSNSRDGDSSDASSVITRREKRTSSSSHTPRRSSALSDTSDSEDEVTEEKCKMKTRGKLQRVEPSVKSPVIKTENHSKHKLDSEQLQDEECSDTNTKVHPSPEAPANPFDKDNVRRQALQVADNYKFKAETTDCSSDSMNDKTNTGKIETHADVSLGNEEQGNNSRPAHARFLRSMSSPPTTRSQKRSTKSTTHLGTYSRISTRNRGSGHSSNEDPKEENMCKGTEIASDSGDQDGFQNVFPVGFIPSRLTRSKSKLGSFAGIDSGQLKRTRAKSQSLVKDDSSKSDLDLESTPMSPRRRSGSRKRTLSDSQIPSTQEELRHSENLNFKKSITVSKEESLNDGSKTDGKTLVRSETEEFVACMDDAPTENQGKTDQNEPSVSANQNDTDEERHYGKRSCRRKTPLKDEIAKVTGPTKGHNTLEQRTQKLKQPDSIDELVETDAAGTSKSAEESHLDQPSTSRQSRTVPKHKLSRANAQQLVPEQRDRQPSTASLASSDRNSPLSPIQEPFQNLDYTRPISPMSPERHVQRVSPILPLFFDLPMIPRMLSPLPPSPPCLRNEEETVDPREDILPEDIQDMMPGPDVQPRMISPLFPTPVPFVVSPLPDIAVPPVISPIPDIQHPPEISPLGDDAPPQSDITPIIELPKPGVASNIESQKPGVSSNTESPKPCGSPTSEQPKPEILTIADLPKTPLVGIQAHQLISPGKSPQLPSPRLFHCVAPLDAITVRPQHSSPSYTQDKTAMRSLNAVLHNENSPEDHRSSFSQKLIARRSSGDEQLPKSDDNNRLGQPGVLGKRRGSTSRESLVGNPSGFSHSDKSHMEQANPVKASEGCSVVLPGSSQKLMGRRQEGMDNSSTVQDAAKKPSCGTASANKLQYQGMIDGTKIQYPGSMGLQTGSDLNEHLRRVSGTEGVTAFSRVIRHREESNVKIPTADPPEGRPREEAGSDTSRAILPEIKMLHSDINKDVNKRQTVPKEQGDASANQEELPKTTKIRRTVGSMWGQMAAESRKEEKKVFIKKRQSLDSTVGQKMFEVKASAKPPLQHKVTIQESPGAEDTHSIAVTGGSGDTRKSAGKTAETNAEPSSTAVDRDNFVRPLTPDAQGVRNSKEQSIAHHTKRSPSKSALAGNCKQGARSQGNMESLPSTNKSAHTCTDGLPKDEGCSVTENSPANASSKSGEKSGTGPGQKKGQKDVHINHVLKLIREHCPNKYMTPVGDCIIEYLQQNAIDLFPAIYAKTIVGNTSSDPIISSPEEQITKAIALWGQEMKRKNMMHYVLKELGRRIAAHDSQALRQTVTFCRVFVAICRETNWFVRVRILCYDIMRERLPHASQLLLAIVAVWPAVLRRKDGCMHPVTSTIESLIMHQLGVSRADPDAMKREEADKISKCFVHLCGWRPLVSESWQESHCLWLVSLLRDGRIATFRKDKKPPALGRKCFETIKALELLASAQGWEWTNNTLIIGKLWPVLKAWSKSLSKGSEEGPQKTPGEGSLAGDTQSCASTASACAVMLVIGNVGQVGLMTHPDSVEQIMKMLIAVLQQPAESIPWPMQLFTAQSIYDLSPSNVTTASKALCSWVGKATSAVPGKLAEQIANLGRKKEEGAMVGEPDIFL